MASAAGKDTIAADVVVDNAGKAPGASKDADKGGTRAEHEEGAVEVLHSGALVAACRDEEVLQAEQVHEYYSSRPQKPQRLRWRAPQPRGIKRRFAGKTASKGMLMLSRLELFDPSMGDGPNPARRSRTGKDRSRAPSWSGFAVCFCRCESNRSV